MFGWTLTDGVARIAIDRGGARNAISVESWHALARIAEQVGAGHAHALILAAAGDGIFSAGADLAEMDRLRDDIAARAAFREAMRAGIDALAALPMPVIAAVDGGCYGAAVALALAADIRIAGDGAVFATTPAKLGIGYPGEDVARLIDRVGRGQAARMLLAADPIDADEAWRIGLAEVRAPDALKAAEALAARVAALAPDAVRLLKRTIADPLAAAGAAAFDAAFGGPEFAARLAAFRNRRR